MNTRKLFCTLTVALFIVFVANQADAQFDFYYPTYPTESEENFEPEPVEQYGTFELRPKSRELTINGTPGDDDIMVRLSPSGINVEHYYYGRLLFSRMFKPYQISKVVFHGESGDDSFRIIGLYHMYTQEIMFDCELHGGRGKDILFGGFGNDLLDGGADFSEDMLYGYGGADCFVTHTYKNGYYREYENIMDFDYWEGDYMIFENAD